MCVESAWRRFYDAPCSWATYSSSEKLPYKSVLPRASCEDTLLLHNMVTSASVCQPKQRSGNNWVYIPTSSLCDPTCFVIISLPLLTRVEVHKQSFCLCSARASVLFSCFPSQLHMQKKHALTHIIISSERWIFVIPRKVIFCLLTDKGNCSKSWQCIPSKVILYFTVETKTFATKNNIRKIITLNPTLIMWSRMMDDRISVVGKKTPAPVFLQKKLKKN